MRMALYTGVSPCGGRGDARSVIGEAKSTKVAAILPQSRNLMARLPRRQPVTPAMAAVAERSTGVEGAGGGGAVGGTGGGGGAVPGGWRPGMVGGVVRGGRARGARAGACG